MKTIEKTPKAPAARTANSRPRKLQILVPDHFRESLQKIAEAGGYDEGVDEFIREIYMDHATLFQLAERTACYSREVDLDQVKAVAVAVRVETLRHTPEGNRMEFYFAKVLGLKGEAP